MAEAKKKGWTIISMKSNWKGISFELVPAQAYVGQFLMTFEDYLQRQEASSVNMDEVLQMLKESARSAS